MNEPRKSHVVGRLPDVTHLGEIGTLLEEATRQAGTGLELKRKSYTANGVEWELTDKHDGGKYQLVLMPVRG